MKASYEFNLKKGFDKLYVQGNFVLIRYHTTFDLRHDKNFLENYSIMQIRKKKSLEKKAKEGKIISVDIDDNLLERFCQCVRENKGIKYGPEDDDPVLLSAIDILGSIKVQQGIFE